jgi:hypothetical protein
MHTNAATGYNSIKLEAGVRHNPQLDASGMQPESTRHCQTIVTIRDFSSSADSSRVRFTVKPRGWCFSEQRANMSQRVIQQEPA